MNFIRGTPRTEVIACNGLEYFATVKEGLDRNSYLACLKEAVAWPFLRLVF